MIRPRKFRQLRGVPAADYFKPAGIPLRMLQEVTLHADEFEAIKLHEIDELKQIDAAEKMGISQPTFARILQNAHNKVARALVHGHAIRIEKNISEE